MGMGRNRGVGEPRCPGGDAFPGKGCRDRAQLARYAWLSSQALIDSTSRLTSVLSS
jgi:hypothetical protein